MVDYLPDNAQSTEAIEVMEEEFEGAIPNANVMIYDVSIQEALVYKEKLESIDGVTDVIWLDDVMDIKTPIEVADQDVVESYYQNNNALFSFVIADGEEVRITDEIYEIIGEENALAGEAMDTATQQKMAFTETMYATALLVPIIIIILILSTTSWVEPLFFLMAIGISVLINLGTNIFIGEISFVTQSVAPILQLAVSLDYAIFLLHSFSDYRKKVGDPKEAMQLAIKRSFPAIIASASTTFFGFIALSLMNFEIGSDLGFNLVKGIVFSFISVMVFLPAFTIMFYKWIDKTQHRPFIPNINRVGKGLLKLKYPVLILVILLIVPAFMAQSQTDFIYGIGEQPEETRAGIDIVKIEDEFGKNTQMVLLVPKGEIGKEEQLAQDLLKNDEVKSIMSYVTTVGAAIPPEYLDEDVTEQFYSDNYSRFILNTTTEDEGDEAFALVETVEEMTSDYYEDFYMLGESVTLYDIKSVVTDDDTFVNVMTIVTIALALIVAFKSLSFPIVLLLTIQASVWINLAIPYFTETPLVFVGYLIVSTVQLAATIDYAILLTEDYTLKRKEMPALQAIKQSLNDKFFAILISASILSTVGFILWLTSTNPIVSSIGLLLGRGALLAFLLVIIFLPALLVLCDKVIEKTTWKANFFKE
ncbi:efflux RND transporter permease subunit [Oceanobacillus indicireducens]|nr:MMPL family transporter [Oceanobacillus indicireducens]